MIIECLFCGWSGEEEELRARTDDPRDRNFEFCPVCRRDDFEEAEEDYE